MLPKRQSSSSPSLVAYQRTPSLTTSAGKMGRTLLAEHGRREREIKRPLPGLKGLCPPGCCLRRTVKALKRHRQASTPARWS